MSAPATGTRPPSGPTCSTAALASPRSTKEGRNFVDDVGVGDLWYFPKGIPHSIQGLEPDGCEFLLVFDDGSFSEDNTFLLSDWFKHVPPDVLGKNFGVQRQTSATRRIPTSSISFRCRCRGRLPPTALPAPRRCRTPSAIV